MKLNDRFLRYYFQEKSHMILFDLKQNRFLVFEFWTNFKLEYSIRQHHIVSVLFTKESSVLRVLDFSLLLYC